MARPCARRDPEPAVAFIRSLGEPTDIAVSQLAIPPRDDVQRPAPTQEPVGSESASHGMNTELDLPPLERRIGKRSAAVIDKHLGLKTAGALLNYFPRRYLNRGELTPISKLPLDEEVTLIARVLSNSTRQMRPAVVRSPMWW